MAQSFLTADASCVHLAPSFVVLRRPPKNEGPSRIDRCHIPNCFYGVAHAVVVSRTKSAHVFIVDFQTTHLPRILGTTMNAVLFEFAVQARFVESSCRLCCTRVRHDQCYPKFVLALVCGSDCKFELVESLLHECSQVVGSRSNIRTNLVDCDHERMVEARHWEMVEEVRFSD